MGLGGLTMRPHKLDLHSEVSRDLISPETGRRVSAALHLGGDGVQLFLLNGGTEPEYLHVDVLVPGIREPLCCGSFGIEAGKHHIVEVERPTRSAPLRVRILGGPEPIVLEQPDRRLVTGPGLLFGALAAAFAILIAPQPPSYRPATVANLAPLPAAHGRPHGPEHHAPRRPPHHAAVALHRPRLAPVVAILRPPARLRPAPVRPSPRLDSLRAPAVITGTQPIPVTFRAVAQQVRIVAKIGPKTLETRIVAANRGRILLASPPRSPLTRILTVEAWAQSGGRSASREAMIVLLPLMPSP